MSTPIVFVHRGNDEYLLSSLLQAKRSNPTSKVILLGDDSNSHFGSEFVQHYRITDVDREAERFSGLYRHSSTNSYAYELFCFQRWFLIRDFLKANGMTEYCYLDSDTMLYADIDDPVYRSLSFRCTWFQVNPLRELERFCDLILEYYRDPDLFERLASYAEQIAEPVVSDMVFSSLYLKHFPDDEKRPDRGALNTFRYDGLYQGRLIDANIGYPYNHYLPAFLDEPPFEALGGRKKVFSIEGKLFCRLRATGAFIPVGVLHFQGPGNKAFIPYFLIPQVVPDTAERLIFDYERCRWIPADME